ncbi:hypothetical protein GNI_123340 [Gregarina niphandrodes]|uniref:Uncharacterized protein n=1 Tax=Gregarina niphandrodes TaxID=110365 RepID=A0A023B2D2_GRENI|nr:hypothetical protein GNI_123340 [Gregarina niphandrodes]EZG51797.1 hypothetical protein GNI_123340 [Gregarina niphandrodes]|eukprot:XP_011131908.1 hypothetical protein GNI_123340 [Gregarina niphandrodes]
MPKDLEFRLAMAKYEFPQIREKLELAKLSLNEYQTELVNKAILQIGSLEMKFIDVLDRLNAMNLFICR